MLRRLRRRIVMRQALFKQQGAADMHGGPVDIERHAGASRRRDDAAPIRIGAMDGGLHQQRVRNRPRHLTRRLHARCVAHRHGDHLRSAFSAAHDAERQLAGDGHEPLEQRRVSGFVYGHAARA